MPNKNFHSVPFGNNWAVKKEGVNKPISTHYTQAKAEEMTRKFAKQAEVEAVYHNRHGQIKEKNSYGNDPNPPRDKD
jgi:hypothetical protein